MMMMMSSKHQYS